MRECPGALTTHLVLRLGLVETGEEGGNVERLGEDPVDSPELMVELLGVDVPPRDQGDPGAWAQLPGVLGDLAAVEVGELQIGQDEVRRGGRFEGRKRRGAVV